MELNLKGKTVRSPKIGMKKCRGLSASSMVLFFPFRSPATACTAMAEEKNRGIRDGGKGPWRLAARKWGLINYSSGKIDTPGLWNPRIEDFPRKDLDSEEPLQP